MKDLKKQQNFEEFWLTDVTLMDDINSGLEKVLILTVVFTTFTRLH